MKKIALLMIVMLCASYAHAQHHQSQNGHRHEIHNGYHRSSDPVRGGRVHHFSRHHDAGRVHGPVHADFRDINRRVMCVEDWQSLWNGCHVRLKADRVHIYNDKSERLLSGEEIVLLPNGMYLVRLGDLWRVHNEKGDRVFNVWGYSVELMDNGLFRCSRNNKYYYYDRFGNSRE